MPGANCPSTGCCRRSSDDGRPAAVRPSPPRHVHAASTASVRPRPPPVRSARARPDRPHPASRGLRRPRSACTRPCRVSTRCRRRPCAAVFAGCANAHPVATNVASIAIMDPMKRRLKRNNRLQQARISIYTGGLYALWIYGGGLSGCRAGFFAACAAAFVNGSAPARALICNSLRPPASAATAWANGNPDDPRRAPGSAPRQPPSLAARATAISKKRCNRGRKA